jgi:hypothetical protein
MTLLLLVTETSWTVTDVTFMLKPLADTEMLPPWLTLLGLKVIAATAGNSVN